MKLISVMLPKWYIEELDKLVENNIYSSRSEAIRNAIRDLLKEKGRWNK